MYAQARNPNTTLIDDESESNTEDSDDECTYPDIGMHDSETLENIIINEGQEITVQC